MTTIVPTDYSPNSLTLVGLIVESIGAHHRNGCLVPINSMYCEQCGIPVNPSARFCRSCGFAVSAASFAAVESNRIQVDTPTLDPEGSARKANLERFKYRVLGACDRCGYDGPFGWDYYHYRHFSKSLLIPLAVLGLVPVVPLLLITFVRRRCNAQCPSCGTWMLLKKHGSRVTGGIRHEYSTQQ